MYPRKWGPRDVKRQVGVEGMGVRSGEESWEDVVGWDVFRAFPFVTGNQRCVVAVGLVWHQGKTGRSGESRTRGRIAKMAPNDEEERMRDRHQAFRRQTTSAGYVPR